ncbi:MAG: SapC family protein [Asticcacaulis sp.]
MAEQHNNDATLTGNVLFYKNPEPLTPETHGSMGISAVPAPHAFVAETNVVPLTVAEFPAASLSFPIVFIGDNYMPVAAMGLSSGQNVFVSPEGTFKSDAYLPAFARRYPFVFANDESQDRMILCVDTQAPMVKTSNPDVPFFEGGKASAYVEKRHAVLLGLRKRAPPHGILRQAAARSEPAERGAKPSTVRKIRTVRPANRRRSPNISLSTKRSWASCPAKSWSNCVTMVP